MTNRIVTSERAITVNWVKLTGLPEISGNGECERAREKERQSAKERKLLNEKRRITRLRCTKKSEEKVTKKRERSWLPSLYILGVQKSILKHHDSHSHDS